MSKICIYAICKNEKQFIDKWLDSMSEADYIVVLDTGSTDGTYELLKSDPRVFKCEQKIINPWRFDVARNESMKLIPEDANILFCTDLDELLDKGWSKPLREQWIDGFHKRGYYTYAWSHLPNGAPGRVFTYDKIHSRDWHWQFPVHEMLVLDNDTQDLPYEQIIDFGDSIYLHHWQVTKDSRDSYLNLLELRKQEYPHDYYGKIYLAHEYYYRGFYQKSIDELQDILNNYSEHYTSLEQASCYLFIGDAYKALEQYSDSITAYQQALLIEPTYREPYLNLANLLNNLQYYHWSIGIIQECLSKTYRHYTWLERDTSWTYEPYDLLGIAYYYIGDYNNSFINAHKALQYDTTDERLIYNLKFSEDKIYGREL